MSPEQACGESVDQRSDLFSLGSVLYAMCTGRSPFRAETSYGVLRRINDDEPKPIREINPEIPEWLCRIISRLMSKDTDTRIQTAEELAGLLEECLAHIQQPTVVALPESLAPSSQAGFVSRFPRSRVLSAIALLGCGVLALLLWQVTAPPDISGEWNGDGWGQVTLERTGRGKFSGTYTDTFGPDKGRIDLKWSKVDQRYRGTWGERQRRSGKLSVELKELKIRGFWTASAESEINPGSPDVEELVWVRHEDLNSESQLTLSAGRNDVNAEPLFGHRQVNKTEDELQFLLLWPRGSKMTSLDGQTRLDLPGRMRMRGNRISFSLKNLPNHEDQTLYGSINRVPINAKTRQFLNEHAISLDLDEGDLRGASHGTLTQYVFLPHQQPGEKWAGHFGVLTKGLVDAKSDEEVRKNFKKIGELLVVFQLSNHPLDGDAETYELAPARTNNTTEPFPQSREPSKTTNEPRFSKPKEIVLSIHSLKFMLDLDTGKTMDLPATVRPEQSKMDVHPGGDLNSPKGLTGLNLSGLKVPSGDWDSTVSDIHKRFESYGRHPLKEMKYDPKETATYFFQTNVGTIGVLQLLALTDDQKGIRIRYKTLKSLVKNPDKSQEQSSKTTNLYRPDENKSVADPRKNSLQKLPDGLSKQARYCLLKFGETGQTQIWLIQDRDWLYVDLNGDGDLSSPDERFAEKEEQGFLIPDITSRGYVIPPTLQSDPQVRAYFPMRISWQKAGEQNLWVRLLVEKKYWQESVISASATKPEFAPILHFDGPLRYFLLHPTSQFTVFEHFPSLSIAIGTFSETGDITSIDLNDPPLEGKRTVIPELQAWFSATDKPETREKIETFGLTPDEYGSYLIDTLKTTEEMQSGTIEIEVVSRKDSPFQIAPLKTRLPLVAKEKDGTTEPGDSSESQDAPESNGPETQKPVR